MIAIKLYQTGIIDAEIPFPDKWNELDVVELEAIARVMQSDLKTVGAAKSIILLEIIKNRCKVINIAIAIIERLDPEDLMLHGLPLIDFLYKDNSLTKQPFPQLKIGFKNFAGPASDFEDLTAGEYEAAEVYFLQFKDNPDPAFLANLAAVLYRPDKVEFVSYHHKKDEYRTYNHAAVANKFSKLPAHILMIIFIWYSGCRGMLPLYFPTLYEGGSSSAETDLMVFTKCIHASAGVKNGNRNQVRRTLLKALYFEMDLEAIKAKELKEYYERNK